jgi:PAS domain S-box-containing protein
MALSTAVPPSTSPSTGKAVKTLTQASKEVAGESHLDGSAELAEVKAQLRELEQLVEAIRTGAVDSLIIGPPGHEQVHHTADRSYRLIVEAMNEGAATVSTDGVILGANPRLGSMTCQSVSELIGIPAANLIAPAHRPEFGRLLDIGLGESARGEVDLTRSDGTTFPVLMAVSGFDLDDMFLRCLVLTDLTALRAAESQEAKAHEAVREQNTFLEQAQEALGLGWWASAPDQDDMVIWSPQAHRIYGLVPGESEVKVATLWGRVHPDDRAAFAAARGAALAGGDRYQVEHRIIRPDGALRWILQAAVVERDDAGAPVRLLGVCQDITDRKSSEDEIRAAAAYNRSLIEASLNPMFTIGRDGAISDVNTATEQATGYQRAELLGTWFSDYFTDTSLARTGYELAFAGGSVRDYPLELRHRDGHITSVMCNAAVYRDPAGQVLGVFAAARDITETERLQDALRTSEARLRVLFDNAPIGVGEVTLSGELVRVNQYFCRFVGYTADEVLSMRGMRDLLHPDEVEAHLAIRERINSEEIDTYSAEKRFVQKRGEVIWGDVQRSLVRDPAGRPLLYIDTVRDITAERAAEAEVRTLTAELEGRVEQRTAELELSNKNLRAFSYSIAHDLRTPLRGLNGFSEALLEDYGELLGETGRGYANRIQAASERMGAIIDDLLRLSQVTHADMNLVPVDLSAEVAAIADSLRAADPGRLVRFAIQGGVWVTADRILIRTVLDHLVENAWKFTAGRSGASIEFATAPADDDATVCCYVRDNGVGFEPAYAGKLFQPFQRLHTTREFPATGTGVGLASVQRIIERHGGRTWAEGTVDSGATFYFTLDAR